MKKMRLNERIDELVLNAQGNELNSYAESVGIKIGDNENEVPLAEVLNEFKDAENYLRAQLGLSDGHKNVYHNAQMNINEMMTTSGFQILLKRVISDTMMTPTEPMLWLTNVVADTFALGDKDPLTVEFPQMGFLQAERMAEGSEYKTDQPAFTQHIISQRVSKIGCAVHVSEELVNQSQISLIPLYAQGLTNAIARLLESELRTILTTKAKVVFNNDQNTSTALQTTGRNAAQSLNGTFSYFDLITMCGNLINNKYNPTHLLAHPLAWSILATDPILRAQMLTAGQIGGQIWNTTPQFDQSVNMPFGFQYIPYYALDYTPADILTDSGTFSGQAATTTCDLYILEAKKCMTVITRGGTDLQDYDDWFRDATVMKARRYATPTALDNGNAMVAAKFIRLAPNEQAIYTIRTVS